MWITPVWAKTNAETLLYSIDDNKILGRLTNGRPNLMTGDGKVVCVRCVHEERHLKERIRVILGTLAHALFKSPRPATAFSGHAVTGNPEPQSYWLLDMKKQSATRMGQIPVGRLSRFFPSPDFRRGYVPAVDSGASFYPMFDLYYFDIERPSVRKLAGHVCASGWWDNTRILLQTTNYYLVLHEITTDKTASFIRVEQIAEFFRRNGIAEDPKNARPIWFWNERENDFYLADVHKRWSTESYLIKLERPAGQLQLLSRRFQFEWHDQLDRTARYYLYSGSQPVRGGDGVYLRDLQSGTTRILVPPANGAHFSLPRFYHDSVIYVRSNALWRINLDGSNNIKLFPPPNAGVKTPNKVSGQ